jgi:hypothetical protein
MTQNNNDIRQSLSSQNIIDLSSPRLSGVRYPYYGVNDYYPAQTQQAVDDIINKYVRKGDQSPAKTNDPLRQSNYSPATKALINAENTVNALRQSGVNPVVATDKTIAETDLHNKYGLIPQGHLAGVWDRSQWWGPEGYRYGGWPGYYPGWRADGTTPAPEVNLRASVVEASKNLSSDDFYKKYGFYPSNYEGRWGWDGRNWDGKTWDGRWDQYYGGSWAGNWGGRLVDGKWTDSRYEGKWVDGKFVEGKVVDGKWVDGKFPCVDSSYWGGRWGWDGKSSWDGKTWDGRWDNYYGGSWAGNWGGRLVDGKWTDSRFEGKWVDGKWVEGKNVDGKWVDGKFPCVDSSYWGSRWGYDGRTWDGKTWDGKTSWDGRWDPYYSGSWAGNWGGRVVDGKWTDSRFEGKWVDGKWVEGKNVDGKWVDGKFPCVDAGYYGGRWGYDGRTWDGKTWDGKTLDAKWDPYYSNLGYSGLYGGAWGGRLVDGKWTDSRNEGKWVDGKFVEGKVVDGKWVDGKFPVIDSSYWGSRWWDNNKSYGYPYGTSVYPYTRLSTDPLLVAPSKSDKTGYVRQYVRPEEQQADSTSQNASRKASQQVGDDDRFDFDNEKKN